MAWNWNNFIGGAASGAGIGSTIGPWGIVIGALAGGLLSGFLGGEDEARKEAERVAREGIMSPGARARLYSAAIGQGQAQANAALRAGAGTMAARGISGGGPATALRESVARGLGSQATTTMAQIEVQNELTKLQGLQNWLAANQFAQQNLQAGLANLATAGGKFYEYTRRQRGKRGTGTLTRMGHTGGGAQGFMGPTEIGPDTTTAPPAETGALVSPFAQQLRTLYGHEPYSPIRTAAAIMGYSPLNWYQPRMFTRTFPGGGI